MKFKKFKPAQIIGTVKRHPDGFGFLVPNDPQYPDVYVPRHEMTGVMSGDQIEVKAMPEQGGDRLRGDLIRIIERKVKFATGKIEIKNNEFGILRDESHAWGMDLKVDLKNSTGIGPVKFNNGDWVSVEIKTYPDAREGFTGQISKLIGNPADPNTDNLRMLSQHQIPSEFSKETLQEAKSIPHEVQPHERQDRVDLRNLPIVTIDGVTAKDFDDAILVEGNQRGFRLIVAIADVSHYVKPGSAIDEDAYLRGTSTYFPNFVNPMLPEALSNEMCSLKPNVERLALVAEMDIDFQGEVSNRKFYEGVIKSHARFTYGKAQQILEGESVGELDVFAPQIKKAADLAKILMAKRHREGSLDLELPETVIEVNAEGIPVEIVKSQRLFAHKLIEELMLAANVSVAQFFTDNQMEAIYRIHETPDMENISTLDRFINKLGGKADVSGGKLQKKLTAALEQFRGSNEETVINMLTLRSMKQAQYSSTNMGHFGLGFENYTHFTSPIRRYPDLIVHRLLKAKVTEKKGYKLMAGEDLATAGSMLSACEQRSVKAERQIQAIKKARYMHQYVGQEFDGIVNSITKFGMFVLLRQFDVDGLVRLDDLGVGRWEFDKENIQMINEKNGQTYNLGDPLKILVTATDTENGNIDFTIVGVERAKFNSPRAGQGARQDRGGSRNNRGRREDKENRFGKKKHGKKDRHRDEEGKRAGNRGENKKNRNKDHKKAQGPQHPNDVHPNDRRPENKWEKRPESRADSKAFRPEDRFKPKKDTRREDSEKNSDDTSFRSLIKSSHANFLSKSGSKTKKSFKKRR